MTTIITAAGAAQFLALVPRLAGFRPVRSVALVPFHRSRTIGVLRVDLPPADGDVGSVAATLIGMVCKIREADAVAVVVYTDDALLDDGAITREGLVHALIGRADACGIHVTDALCVASDGWGSYLDDPPVARALEELADDELVERLPPDMREPLGDQAADARLPSVDLAQRERVGRALLSLDAAIDAVSAATGSAQAAQADLSHLDPQALAAVCALDDIPALFEDALDWDPATLRPFDAAALVWCLARPGLRDVALLQWCADIDAGDAALDAQLRWQQGEEYPAKLGSVLWGDGDRPDADRLERALELTRHAAALAPRESRPGPLALAGWLSWALGRSTHAGWYAEQALEIDAEHGLSGILMSMISGGHLPEWAFQPPRDETR